MRSFYLTLLLIIAQFTFVLAQKNITGKVLLLNSRSRTGALMGLENVKIEARNTLPVTTNSEGGFTIPVYETGEQMPLTIKKEGYILVNRKDLEFWDWNEETEVLIFMEDEESWKKSQQNIYESCETILSETFKHKIDNIQIPHESKRNNNLSIEAMEKAIWDFEKKKEQILRLLPQITQNIGSINQDFAIDPLIPAFEFFLKGFPEKAIDLLDKTSIDASEQFPGSEGNHIRQILAALELQAEIALVNMNFQKSLEVYQTMVAQQSLLKIGVEQMAYFQGRIGLIYKILGNHEASNLQFQEMEHLLSSDETRLVEATSLAYQQLAGYYYEQGDFSRVLELKQKALKYFEEAPNIGKIELSEEYASIAQTFFLSKDFESAIFFLNKAIQIQERLLDKDHPLLAKSYLKFGRIYASINTQERSLNFFEKGLNIQKKSLSDNHPDLIQTYISVGKIYESIGDEINALLHYEAALAIGEKNFLHQQPEMGITYSNVAALYEKMGDYEKSLEFHKKALSLFEAVLEPDNPALIISYKQIASVYEKIGEYNYALAFYENVLKLEEKTFGKTYHGLANTFYQIAKLHHAVGNYHQSNIFVEKSLRINGGFPISSNTGSGISFTEKGGFAAKVDSIQQIIQEGGSLRLELTSELAKKATLDELRILIQSGSHSMAETNAMKFLGTEPNNDKIRVLLTIAFAYQGKIDKATSIWFLFKNRVLETGETFTEYLLGEINNLKKSGQYNVDIEQFRTLVVSR